MLGINIGIDKTDGQGLDIALCMKRLQISAQPIFVECRHNRAIGCNAFFSADG